MQRAEFGDALLAADLAAFGHDHGLDAALVGDVAADAEHVEIAAEREHRAQAAHDDEPDPAVVENVEALFEQHPRAEVADEGENYKARYHYDDRQRGVVEYRVQQSVQQQTAAQSRACRDAVFENGLEAAHGDNVSGGLHPAPSEDQQCRCGENKSCGAVDDRCRPVTVGDGDERAHVAEVIIIIETVKLEVSEHVDDGGEEVEHAVKRI